MERAPVVQVNRLAHDYGSRRALAGIDLRVDAGEIFGLLGPNGGGKTTLFRILATLVRPTAGNATVFGHDVVPAAAAVRREIGVVFQSPALDRQLTVRENLHVHGRLYGLTRKALGARIDEVLARVRLADRAGDRVAILSGGLRRRVEIAKAVLHRPRLLLLDEPAAGLDPGARLDLWDLLTGMRGKDGVTVLLTTHDVQEAERCDRIAILDGGRIVTLGTPADLKREVGGDVIVVQSASPGALRDELERRFGGPIQVVDGTVRLERPGGHLLIPRIVEACAERIEAVTLSRPSLLDVFVHKTGRPFDGEAA